MRRYHQTSHRSNNRDGSGDPFPTTSSPSSSPPRAFNNVCVTCGACVDCIYKEYSHGNIRLARCGVCTSIVDKYIEFEMILLIIDLILLKVQAYSHIIFNRIPRRRTSLSALFVLMVVSFMAVVYTKQYLYTVDLHAIDTLTPPDKWIHHVWRTPNLRLHMLLHICSTFIQGLASFLGVGIGTIMVLSFQQEVPTLPNLQRAVRKALKKSEPGTVSHYVYAWLLRTLGNGYRLNGGITTSTQIRKPGRFRTGSENEVNGAFVEATEQQGHSDRTSRRRTATAYTSQDPKWLFQDFEVKEDENPETLQGNANGSMRGWGASSLTVSQRTPELAQAEVGVRRVVSPRELNNWVVQNQVHLGASIMTALIVSSFPRNLMWLTIIWPYPPFFPTVLGFLTQVAHVAAMSALMRWPIYVASIPIIIGCICSFASILLLQALELEPEISFYF